MSDQRLKRKLKQLLEVYNSENKKRSSLISKINKIESELKLPLTQKEKVMKKEVEVGFHDKLQQEENKRKYNTTKKRKLQKFQLHNIDFEEAEKLFEDHLNENERAYVERYKEWYNKKIKEIQDGVREGRKSRSDSKVVISELLILLNEGMSVTDAAVHFGVDRATVSRHKVANFKHEYKAFENKYYQTRGKDWNGLNAELLCEYLNAGRTVTEIAESHRISQAHLSQFKNKMIYKIYSLK